MFIPQTSQLDGELITADISEPLAHMARWWWPHWVDTKSPEYSQLKKLLSLKYGTITFCITLFIVVFLPLYDYCYEKYFYSNFNKIINYLRLPTLGRNNFIILHISLIKTVFFWSAVLAFLSFYETFQDWVLIAKRLGRVPGICLPTVLFLSLRPSPLPNTLYLSLLPIHKWLSRIIVLQGGIHTIIYLAYFKHTNSWFKIYKPTNIHGIILMLAFLIIASTSLSWVRRLDYRVFFINHYIMSWIIVIFLFLHAKPGMPYITALNILILSYQIYYRLTRTRKTKLDVIDISPSLSMILIPNTALSFKSGIPGCHIRVNEFFENKWHDLWSRFCVPLQHPYTLTTLPSDPVQRLIVKNSHFKFQKGKKYYITGPFLPFVRFLKPRNEHNAKSLSFKIKCKRCLIVVGGSLISFALPIMRVLNYNGCSVKIVWVVRDIEDLKILNYFANTIINDDSIDIFITGNYSEESKNAFINSISEFDNKRKNKILQNQEDLLSGLYQNGNDNQKNAGNTNKVSNKIPLLKSEPVKNYGSTETSNSFELGLSKMERHGSDSSLSRKSSLTDIIFGNDNEEELENVDIDLNSCDYGIEPTHSNHSPDTTAQHVVSAGIDDSSAYEELDFSMNYSSPANIKDYSSLIKLNLGVAVKFGRPKLGGSYYNWCINQACIGPVLDISRGENICCKDVPNQIMEGSGSHNTLNNNNKTQMLLNFKKCNGQPIGVDDSDALYMNEHFLQNKKLNKGKINDDVWVIGAGPVGLVNNVRLWANDCGFHFHAESFSV